MMNRQDFLIERFGVDTLTAPPYQIDVTMDKVPELFVEMGLRVGAEIGVERGVNAEYLLKGMPELTLFCVDCWQPYEGYREGRHYSAARLDSFYELTKTRLAAFGARVVLRKQFSVEAAAKFADESLDFVFIDANHSFNSCAEDLAVWSPKVKKGGIISGHDFYNKELVYECVEVERAVRTWTTEHGITVWFVTADPSWMWVRS
jgi:hypothetical protein